MNKQAPEDFNDLAADLALCVADVLDHPDCPNGLRDVLHEITDELTNAIGPSVSESLRALADLAKARDSGDRILVVRRRTARQGETYYTFGNT
jgi:hypothetical protein